MSQWEAAAQAAHAEAVQTRQEAPQSMALHQGGPERSALVVERLSRQPNEVANALAKAATRREAR